MRIDWPKRDGRRMAYRLRGYAVSLRADFFDYFALHTAIISL